MFGMGMPEIMLILAIALIVIGPRKLPEIARTLGKAVGEFRRATNDLKSAVNIDDEISAVRRPMTVTEETPSALEGTDSTAEVTTSPESAEDVSQKDAES